MVDVIGEGFDATIRIAVLPDCSLVVRRLCEMRRYLVGSPTYLNRHGRPKHPLHRRTNVQDFFYLGPYA
jgi:DNA-binding transcriptional LysR family regulator